MTTSGSRVDSAAVTQPKSTAESLQELYVVKRSGKTEPISFDKVLRRIQALCRQDTDMQLAALNIDHTIVAQKVCAQIYAGVTTTQLDELAAQICSSLSTDNPAYGELAARIVVSNHHKSTPSTFEAAVELLFHGPPAVATEGCDEGGAVTTTTHRRACVSQELYDIVQKHATWLEAQLHYERDYTFNYFGLKTLERSYLLKVDKKIVERPQHMWMRVALGLYGTDLTRAAQCYHELSRKWYTHATPTLFNAGTPHSQLASCFLLAMKSDSIEGIFETLKDCAQISKHSGGIGLWIHNIRSVGSEIRGTNGCSNGVVPMLRVFNDTARYVDQGGGKRNGSFAIYLEPWHPDILDFLQLKKNHGDELARARDLFYSMWVSDLFMRRVRDGGDWTLFNPDRCPDLSELWGEKFEMRYEAYEREGCGVRTLPARTLWHAILESQTETGTPYILFKDSCNRKSNQQNLGTIRSSNLCTEILEYSSPDETAVCNLASISLPTALDHTSLAGRTAVMHSRPDCPYCKLARAWLLRFGMNPEDLTVHEYATPEARQAFCATMAQAGRDVKTFPQLQLDGTYIGGYDELVHATRPTLNFGRLERMARSLTRNLNQTIDRTFYPTKEARTSNLRHRPIGIGVQGLANLFMEMRIAFDSEEAATLNREIFATMYYGAMHESMELARERAHKIEAFRVFLAETCGLSSAARARPELLDGDGGRGDDDDARRAAHRDHLHQIQPVLPDEVAMFARALSSDMPITTERSGESGVQYAGAYTSFRGSPLHRGQFQFDLWDAEGGDERYPWDELRTAVQRWGARNSLLVAPMPTASTAQILGNTECFEPITSNLYVRRTLAGEFVVVNDYLLRDLIDLGVWNREMKEKIMYHEGSVAAIEELPGSVRALYKTVWEISQKTVIDMAAARGRYICQSQSMNLFLASPTVNQLTSMLFYGWERGLKTGQYYLRTKPASKAQQFTLDAEKYGCTNCSA